MSPAALPAPRHTDQGAALASAPPPGIYVGVVLAVAGKSFAPSIATITLTDLEGNPRTLTTDVLAPIPEPSSLALLPLAIAALHLRRIRHRT